MRTNFDKQMEQLHKEVLEMGSLLEQAGESVYRILETCDIQHVENVKSLEQAVDQKERDIESLCLKLLLQQQPVAGDLRKISSALKMITDMERIGDQIADIAEIARTQKNTAFIKKLKHLPQISLETNRMLKTSLDAFVRSDLTMAENVINMDDIIDNLFRVIRNEITIIMQDSGKSADYDDQALDFLMMTKYYERIGDHIVNIAEWVIFSITGTHKDKE